MGNKFWHDTLQKVCSDEKVQISTTLVTHWHPDHVGGISDLKLLSPTSKIYKNQLHPGQGQEDITDGQVFTVEGATVIAHHTPGHTVDHMCFYLVEEKALFTGDNVLGHGTTVFEDLGMYIASLRKMERIPGLDGRGYPGHGEVIDVVKSKVEEYIAHRMVRERQVMNVLKEGVGEGRGGDAMTALDIVQVIYKEVPKELWTAAEGGVTQILTKLEGDKKVVKQGGRWVLWERSGLA